MKFLFLIHLLFFFSIFSGIYAYSISDFNEESGTLLAMENSLVKSAVPCFMDMCSSDLPESNSWDLGLCYGSAVAPLFVSPLSASGDYKLFSGGQSLYDGSDEYLTSFFLSGGIRLPLNCCLSADFAWVPGLPIGNSTNNNMKIGCCLFYRIFNESASWVGLAAGGGYHYASGTICRGLDLSYSDSNGSASYNGGFSSGWGYHAANLEVQVQKDLFSLVTFYGKAAYYLMAGSCTSELDGSLSISGSQDVKLTDSSTGQGFVLSGGMGISAGVLNICAEAGRDWISQAFYADIGLKISL